MTFRLLTTFLICITTAAFAQEREANVTLSRGSAEVGEKITMSIEFPGNGEISEIDLNIPEEISPLLQLGEVKKVGSREFTADFFPLQEGELQLNSVTFEATDSNNETIEFSAGTAGLSVKPVPGEATMEFNDFSSPREVPFDYLLRNLTFIAGVLLALALLALVIYWIGRLLRRRKEQKAYTPPRPPIEIAMENLQDLITLKVYREYGVEKHYTRLSNILRGYLEGQYKRPALEMTEDELIDAMKTEFHSLLGSEDMVALLKRSSMAKFARQALTEDVALGDCKAIRKFLERERERMAAEEARAGAEKGEAAA